MIGIVRIALLRPLTFIVMAILILIIGVLAAIRTPVDIFPNIGAFANTNLGFMSQA